ncbi:PhoU domain-containing protein [Tsukamurella pseudospumae]|uniref:PhoU domain-containing protein n=1 Tax=Tsukamurella pseudospumae TaxID=239498 RepID=A0A137ZHM6_9ACTN|nr:PhoU domain-containing protein [Tsukamurella pseudospumae]KXO97663.1 hypothetical protein AXK61_21705 [Tsukamurella pseudospumae]
MPAQTDRDLADLDFTLVAMCGLAVASIVAATTALAEANRPAAENALALTSELTAMSGPAETQILSLLGRPSPQSGTIRHAVAGVHLTGDIVRMGEHAGRIAEIVRERYRELPRGGGREILLQMGLLAHELALKAYQALINHDAGSGNTIDTHNHDMRLLRAGDCCTER